MATHSYAVWIAAPRERVYDLYTDLDRIGEWQEGNPRITDLSGDPSRAGATYMTRRGRSANRSEVIVAERPTKHVVRIDGPMGLRAEITSQFAPEEHGTRLTIGLDARWRSPLLGRVLEWAIFNPRTARRELSKLKAIAEREDRDKTP
jgi:uncharacterized protein YndB with AHSA1/START domain